MAVPFERNRCCIDGDSTFPFLIHEVHYSVTLVHFSVLLRIADVNAFVQHQATWRFLTVRMKSEKKSMRSETVVLPASMCCDETKKKILRASHGTTSKLKIRAK